MLISQYIMSWLILTLHGKINDFFFTQSYALNIFSFLNSHKLVLSTRAKLGQTFQIGLASNCEIESSTISCIHISYFPSRFAIFQTTVDWL